MSVRPTAFTNVRLVDPASGYDGPGALIVTEGVIADVVRGSDLGTLSPDVEVVDGRGATLMPGLIDIRVKTGEPGTETKETLKSAALVEGYSANLLVYAGVYLIAAFAWLGIDAEQDALA